MKKILLFIFLIASINSFGKVPKEIVLQYKKIITLIRQNKVAELSLLVKYPLARKNPVPDINNAKAFINYYPTLFDHNFKAKLQNFREIDIMSRGEVYGLEGNQFNGDIWLDKTGKIIAVNYSSDKETANRERLIKEIRKKMYPTVNTWDENIFVLKSEKLLLRIDQTQQGLRYVSWNKGQSIAQKPDVILYNGVDKYVNSINGWVYTFTDKETSYVLEDVRKCKVPEQCGFFLKIYTKDVLTKKLKMQKAK